MSVKTTDWNPMLKLLTIDVVFISLGCTEQCRSVSIKLQNWSDVVLWLNRPIYTFLPVSDDASFISNNFAYVAHG